MSAGLESRPPAETTVLRSTWVERWLLIALFVLVAELTFLLVEGSGAARRNTDLLRETQSILCGLGGDDLGGGARTVCAEVTGGG